MGQDANRAGTLAHDRGRVGHVETGDGAEHDRVSLSGWQLGDALQCGLGVEVAHRGSPGSTPCAAIDALQSAAGSIGTDGRRDSRRKWSIAAAGGPP